MTRTRQAVPYCRTKHEEHATGLGPSAPRSPGRGRDEAAVKQIILSLGED